MELRHLRYFVAVAEEENVSRAALKLHVSQPALSRQIRDLEDELGFQLLERGAKSIKLTSPGRVFLTESKAVLERVTEAVAAARKIAATGTEELHIGYAPTLTVKLLPSILRSFEAAMPQVKIKLHDLSSEEMLAGVRSGILHLAFMVKLPNNQLRGLVFEELLRDPICIAVAPQHPLAKHNLVTIEQAAREKFVVYNRADYPDYHELLGKLFKSLTKKIKIAEEHDGVLSLISAVEAGHGVFISSGSISCMAGPRLKLLPLKPEPAPLVIGIVFSKIQKNIAAKTFIGCAQKSRDGKMN